VDLLGEGTATNVRALSQRCPHLGCRPNPCLEDFWFQCPCHQSRYDRLGIKAAGERYGPAPRGMDRYATEVDAAGVLWVDTARVVLGPLPVALGQPGLIPPLVEGGCV
jgi:cytochrome b6-f complex iron-sulfur subunit